MSTRRMTQATDRQSHNKRSALPLYARGQVPPPRALRVDGLVRHTLMLHVADLQALAEQTLVDDFTCLEGWSVPKLRWHGTPLAAVLDLAQVEPGAQWVQASATEGLQTFSLPLPLAEARTALLAYELDGQPLAPQHGGPLRLVVPRRECFTSIKWLDHLEVCAEPGMNSAHAIATSRLRRSPAMPASGRVAELA